MEYNIKTIENILFEPEILKINPRNTFTKLVDMGEETVEVKYIILDVRMREDSESIINIPVGNTVLPCVSKTTTVREGIIEMPFIIWDSTVTGYDTEKKEPILDETKFRMVLKMYKIDLNK